MSSNTALNSRLADVWNNAMNDGNGIHAVGALGQALHDCRENGTSHEPFAIQDATLAILAPDAGSGEDDALWLAVASNTVGAMMRAARDELRTPPATPDPRTKD